MDRSAFNRAAGAGTPAQLLLVLAGHFIPFVANNLFAVGGVAIALVSGLLYVREDPKGLWPLGAAAAGATGAVVAIAVSAALHDVPWSLLLFGGLASAAAGVLGGALERSILAPRPQALTARAAG